MQDVILRIEDPTSQEELDQYLSDLRLLFATCPQAATIYVNFLANSHYDSKAPAKWEIFKDTYKLDI